MRAARWDVDAEIGGVWTVTVKRLGDGVPLALATPCRLELWATGADPVTTAPAKTVTGVLAGDAKSATFTLTADEISTLNVGTREHRLTIGDPTVGALVMARGWFTIRGRVRDL